MIALIEAYKAGLLRKQFWFSNIVSGIIVGIVAFPLAMAFAIASGARPEQGLYTSIVTGILVSIFGGSRLQIAGPTGAFVIILAGITHKYGIIGLQVTTLMAGFILLLMGFAKLGNVIKFIPDPVVVGFTSGIGVIIFVGACKDFFGLYYLPHAIHFHEKLFLLGQSLPQLNFPTTELAFFSLFLILASSKIFKKVPSLLIAIVTATLLQTLFHFSTIATIGTAFGGIPQIIPRPHLPQFSFNHLLELIGPAFSIAMLGAIESLLSAVVADGMSNTNTHHSSNQELIGQGIANIVSPLFGGFAATGAIARTATNIKSGGNSPLSGIVHSFTLFFIIILFAPIATHIPLCTLAAILFVVAYNMSDVHRFIYILKYAPKNDVIVLLTTFLLTVFTDLVVAINIGIILAMLLFVHRLSQSISVEKHQNDKLIKELLLEDTIELPNDVVVYSINGPFFFGAAENFEHTITTISGVPKYIIFRLRNVPFMDFTGLQTFYDLIVRFHKKNIKIYLCEANQQVTNRLKAIRLFDFVEDKKVFTNLNSILLAPTFMTDLKLKPNKIVAPHEAYT